MDELESNPKGLILIAEDEPLIVEMVTDALVEGGFVVRAFYNPAALLASSLPTPNLLITDFSMPQMNGIDLMIHCRFRWPALRVLLMSGTLRQADIGNTLIKPDAFLPKPFSAAELLQMVQSLLISTVPCDP